ncbi:MAG: metallophosphoesterase family protein [Solirubrobacteraceae bacterium]|nr:metallophosphoesterase family protein [Solirubrobacteraceae bacterium]
MPTLVISDLHLGSRAGRDVLRRPAAIDRLCDAIAGADRLVLLGDTVEMLEGRPQGALADAEPVLRAMGAALGPGRSVVLVPGNHDHALVRPWLRRHAAAGRRLGPSHRIGISSSPGLRAIASWLKPARLEVRYPGVDLGDGIWAHHGHYLDRHLVRRPEATGRATADDYERSIGAAAARLTGDMAAAMPRPIGDAFGRAAQLAMRAAAVSRPVIATLPGAGLLAPLSAGALGYQFRRSGLPAMAAVTDHLGVDAADVVFGHVHRAGPRDGDDADEWERGGRRLWNSGCWVYEPLLLAGTSPPHPYWPGGALWIDGGEIRSVGLLDNVAPELLD